MKSIRTFGVAAVAMLVANAVQAASVPADVPAALGGSPVVNVAVDCHADVRRHFLPEYDRRVWHRHRQSNCRVVRADPPDDDDYDGGRRDCHRDVRSHFLPEYGGRVTHKHVGDSCRARVYRQYPDGGSGRNCIQIGVVQFCEQ